MFSRILEKKKGLWQDPSFLRACVFLFWKTPQNAHLPALSESLASSAAKTLYQKPFLFFHISQNSILACYFSSAPLKIPCSFSFFLHDYFLFRFLSLLRLSFKTKPCLFQIRNVFNYCCFVFILFVFCSHGFEKIVFDPTSGLIQPYFLLLPPNHIMFPITVFLPSNDIASPCLFFFHGARRLVLGGTWREDGPAPSDDIMFPIIFLVVTI